MITFGMPSVIETKTVEDSAALCKELGLSFVEVNANFPQFQMQNLDVPAMKELRERYGVNFTYHLDDDLNVADFNNYVMEAYGRTTLDAIEMAKQLEMRVLNMHMAKGPVYTLPQRKVYFFGEYLKDYLERFRVFRDKCEEAIGDSGVKICVENSSGFMDYHKEAIELLLESPVFGLTLDIGHNYNCKRMDEPFILGHHERLLHMHMHDAKDGNKDHQALGKGELDIPKFLKLADEHNCTVVLETKTEEGLRGSVQWLRDHYEPFGG